MKYKPAVLLTREISETDCEHLAIIGHGEHMRAITGRTRTLDEVTDDWRNLSQEKRRAWKSSVRVILQRASESVEV